MEGMRSGLVLATLLAASPLEAFPQSAPPDGCFCLRHVASGQILQGCSGYKPPGGFFSRALCRNSEGESADILMDDAWVVVPNGEPDCDPCQAEKRGSFDGLRQDTQIEGTDGSEQQNRPDPR